MIAPLLLFVAVLYGAVAAQEGTQAQESEDPVVLRVGDYEETLSEFEARFEIAIRGVAASEGMELTEGLRAQLEAFKTSYLEQRATEAVLMQEAQRRGIEVSEDVVTNRVASLSASLPEGETLQTLLDQAGFENEEQLRRLIRETEQIQRTVDAVAQDIEVSDEAAQEFYDANVQMFEQPEQVCARHILVETVEEAQEVMAELEGEADFASLANERTIDPGGQGQGGDLGCFPRGRMVPAFEEAAFAAEVGEPVGPVESQFGQHIILVYERTEAQAANLEEVRPQVDEQVRQQRLNDEIAKLREEADVEVFTERLGVTPPSGETEGEAAPEGEEPEGEDQQ